MDKRVMFAYLEDWDFSVIQRYYVLKSHDLLSPIDGDAESVYEVMENIPELKQKFIWYNAVSYRRRTHDNITENIPELKQKFTWYNAVSYRRRTHE